MGFRMRKSFKIAPGIRLNVSNKSMGVSFGGKGVRTSINSRTGTRTTISIPGTGLSYSMSGKKAKSKSYARNNELQQLRKRENQLEMIEYNRLQVEIFNNTVNMIKEIHKEAEEETNWAGLANMKAKFNPNIGEKGEKEIEALYKLNNYKPSMMEKFSGKAENIIKELEANVTKARMEEIEEYNRGIKIIEVAKRIVNRDLDAYFEAIEIAKPLEDLLEFGSGFEFYVENLNQIEVDFKVNSENVVPKEKIVLTKTGKLSKKVISKSEYFDIEQDYVSSCAIRIARDMFALLPVNEVIINAMDNRLNTSKGIYEETVILSVKFEREILNSLNLEYIDPSDSLANFKHNMKFKKTTGFQSVDKIIL